MSANDGSVDAERIVPAVLRNVGRHSLRLDIRRPDHLAPLLGFVGDELAEIARRARNRHAAHTEPRR